MKKNEDLVYVGIDSKFVKKPAAVAIEPNTLKHIQKSIDEFEASEDSLGKRWFMLLAPVVYHLWGMTGNQEKTLEKMCKEQRIGLALACLYIQHVIEEEEEEKIGHA